MPTRTLAQLRSQVADLAAVTVSPTGRHTPAAVDLCLNEAIGKYYLELIDTGAPMRVDRATVTTSASTTVATHWPANEYVTLPANLLRLLELNITDGQRTISMRPFSSEESQMFEADYDGTNDAELPTFYQLAIDESGNVIARLLPAADAVYTIECIYVPGPTELDDDADTFTFLPGTTNFVLYEAAMSLMERDGIPERDQYQAFTSRRDDALAVLQKQAGRMQQAGTTGMVNTRRMRKYNKWRSREENYGVT
jgi:hypothetical protein